MNDIIKLQRKINLKDNKIVATTDSIDNYQYAYYLHYPTGIEKAFYTDNTECIFKHIVIEGSYKVVFYYRNESQKESINFKFDIIKQNGELKILTEEDKKKLEAEKQKASSIPKTPVEANKLLLAQIAERDNYLIELTSQLEPTKVKLESATKTLELKDQQIAKLTQALKDSEQSFAAKSNQVLQLIERNELVEAHLANVQDCLDNATQKLNILKQQFDILKQKTK